MTTFFSSEKVRIEDVKKIRHSISHTSAEIFISNKHFSLSKFSAPIPSYLLFAEVTGSFFSFYYSSIISQLFFHKSKLPVIFWFKYRNNWFLRNIYIVKSLDPRYCSYVKILPGYTKGYQVMLSKVLQNMNTSGICTVLMNKNFALHILLHFIRHLR